MLDMESLCGGELGVTSCGVPVCWGAKYASRGIPVCWRATVGMLVMESLYARSSVC
jgi:hypothetical protein